MTRLYWSLLALILLFGNGTVAKAQTESVKSAIARMPLTGHRMQDFVPEGWVLGQYHKGDLNGDGLVDMALIVARSWDDVEKNKSYYGDKAEAQPRILVILFATKGGGYKRFAVNGRLYPTIYRLEPSGRDVWGNLYYAVDFTTVEVLIVKGEVQLRVRYSPGQYVDAMFYFRYNAATKNMRLDRFDLKTEAVSDKGEGHKSSEDYVTGERLEYDKKSGRSKRAPSYELVARKSIERVTISFTEARFNDEDSEPSKIRP